MEDKSEIEFAKSLYDFMKSPNSPFQGWSEEKIIAYTTAYAKASMLLKESQQDNKDIKILMIPEDAMKTWMERTQANFQTLCSKNLPALLLNNNGEKKKMAIEAILNAYATLQENIEIPCPKEEFITLVKKTGERYIENLGDHKLFMWIAENMKFSEADYIGLAWGHAFCFFNAELKKKIEECKRSLCDKAVALFSDRIKSYVSNLMKNTSALSGAENNMKSLLDEMFKSADLHQILKDINKEVEVPTNVKIGFNVAGFFNPAQPEAMHLPTIAVADVPSCTSTKQ
jgi:hypothetical protein